MNFKQATDALLKSVTLEDLAVELGVSVQSVRQARVTGESVARRPPPVGWEGAVKKIARDKQQYFKKLGEAI